MAATTAQIPKPHRLAGVHVEELFGLYTFDIRVASSNRALQPSLLILYGDNGTGKTTVLNLIFHLLSSEDNRGHRTYLAGLPFRRVRVRLYPSAVVEAFRKERDLVGDYSLRITRRGVVVAEAHARVGPDNTIRASTSAGTPKEQAAWEHFVATLTSLNLTFFLLGADRRSERGATSEATAAYERAQAIVSGRYVSTTDPTRGRPESDPILEDTVDRLENWVRDQVLRGTTVGAVGASNIYSDVAKRIAGSKQTSKSEQKSADAVERLAQALETRSRPFSLLGLVPQPNLSEIAGALSSAPQEQRQLIANVVAPYLDSIETRLDALDEIQELVSLLLDRINSFFSDKRVAYNLRTGFTIVSPTGSHLRPSQLSSGERQLFRLLGEVLVARQSASIFLIDEPELSLNVKWQRLLVETLLQLVRGTTIQFVLATHSLELLAEHRSNVYRLSPLQG